MEERFVIPEFYLPIELASKEKIEEWAGKYNSDLENADDIKNESKIIAGIARESDHLSKDQLVDIVKWKTNERKVIVWRAEQNDAEWIKEVTRNSFASKYQDKKIDYLDMLNGVDYAVGSAILHFVFPNEYPIIDFRALKTITGKLYHPYQYPQLWMPYCKFCRGITAKYGVDMRTLDKALWKFDEERSTKKKDVEHV